MLRRMRDAMWNVVRTGTRAEIHEGLARQSVRTRRTVRQEIASQTDLMDEQFAAISKQLEKIHAKVSRLGQITDALVRMQVLDADTLPYPERLTAHRYGLYSQNGEDGILLGILGEAGIATRKFVELGSGQSGGGAAVLAAEYGWSGLMVDGREKSVRRLKHRFPHVTSVRAWITAGSINQILGANGFAGEVDVFNLDIDGNDYWVWKAMTVCQPRIVTLEYNSIFGPTRSVTIPYDPDFVRGEKRFFYYGASLTALTKVSQSKGYRLVATDPAGVNAFFLRDDVAPHIPGVAPERAFHMQEKYAVFIQQKNVDVFEWAAENDAPLVEV